MLGVNITKHEKYNKKNNRKVIKEISKYCLLTNDVETTSIWFNSLRDETGLKVLREGMSVLLDLYEKYEIKTTFFLQVISQNSILKLSK